MTPKEYLEVQNTLLILQKHGDANNLFAISMRLLKAVYEDGQRWSRFKSDVCKRQVAADHLVQDARMRVLLNAGKLRSLEDQDNLNEKKVEYHAENFNNF